MPKPSATSLTATATGAMVNKASPRRSHRGFTLVEVLIALALMAVMGGLSWQGLDSLLRSRSAVQAEHARSTVLGTVLAQ